ncbi:hypothetical protein EDD40_0608 [Saccharothrix texasensis]|uniref:Uncharacterized protein n=1 Tax=Saccharothrix texasensis TaxID=103734 RepID=A0A3N1GYH7_9PSEU|nr:hypothetical protein EDD40_0608 [Saccharothrix texasensis]
MSGYDIPDPEVLRRIVKDVQAVVDDRLSRDARIPYRLSGVAGSGPPPPAG